MNKFVQSKGLENTLFFSENGLNIADHIMGAYSNSKEISKIVEYFYENFPEIASSTVKVEDKICSNKKCHYVKNTNLLLEKYPEIIFSKTGYTKKAGGSLAVILDINSKKYTVVILNSTKQGRFDDLEKIINLLKLRSI
jgi:D-alanyl-D-alanine carboxypeptidase